MIIRTLWEHSGDDTELPWMVAAVDAVTIEEWNGLPDFYTKELKANPARRELFIDIPESAVVKLFQPRTVKGNVVEEKDAQG